MDNVGWLFAAMLAVWVGIGLYLLSIALRQRALERRLAQLDRAENDGTNSQT
jgi:CcmD family protein